MASNQHHHSNSHPRQQPPNENNNRPPVANRQQSHNHHKNSSSNHSNHAHDKPANHYQNQNARPVRKKTTPPYFNEKPIFTCVLCCQDFPSARHRAVFAIGACNHMICYYCSTKMRVLCEQSECPTCRQELSEVRLLIPSNRRSPSSPPTNPRSFDQSGDLHHEQGHEIHEA